MSRSKCQKDYLPEDEFSQTKMPLPLFRTKVGCQDIERAKSIIKEAKVCILETGIPHNVAEYATSIARENNAVILSLVFLR